jgi:disulfide bond formation protein DsbB
MLEKIKTDSFLLIFCASLGALLLAYTAEFVFNLVPCMLCIYQRIPYFILLCVSLSGLLCSKSRKYLSWLVILSLIAELLLAAYHIGVEHYWIEEKYMCQIDHQLSALSLGKIASSCSDVRFKFMNLSMAEWNFIYVAAILYAFLKLERKNG